MPDYKLLERTNTDFPRKLHELGRWPERLHCHGSFDAFTIGDQTRVIAIVGARAASGDAMRATHLLAAELAGHNTTVISGGALGIDSAAHRGALSRGGYTVAVMACGIDSYYPRRNQPLFLQVLESGGAIVSPFDIGCPPMRANFVRRNKIIAVLADIVVVVEASTGSGSLHTARFASRLGRRLAAFPGSPGCEALLAHGIPAVSCANDVLDLLAGHERRLEVQLPEAGSEEARVLAALSRERPLSLGELSESLGLVVRQTQRILLQLELQSLVLGLAGQRYLLSPLASAVARGNSAL